MFIRFSCLCIILRSGGFGLSVLSAERVRRLSLGVPVVDEVFPGFESGDFAVL
jgi:hypothetical protein